ncbi:MAG: sulfopyruvate decarboxylase [Candidatus Rokubacteria bacterium]|nr:sulfopyruvate decarboxylase [Candidatus Rokubacteria bacterium]
MTGARRIVRALEEAGVTIVATVPDTWIGRLADEMRRSTILRVVDVASEEEAIAIACGANLTGAQAVVAIQNAGLLNCGAVLASLVQLYRIPCFLLVSYRGDERDPVYYHVPKGRMTEPTLAAWGIRHARAGGAGEVGGQIARGLRWVEEAKAPFVLLFSADDLA